MPGAGKGECANVANNLGFPVVSMGDIVRDHVRSLTLEMTDMNIGSTAHSERERHGYDIWAKRTVEKIEKINFNNAQLLIIDGIRGDAEVSVFKDAFKQNFKTITVLMPDKKRFELLRSRKRSDAPMTLAEFRARDAREAKWGIHRAIEDADYIIMNDGTLEELKTNFSELLKVITG
jgi:dephospho-CoA kinase